MASFTEPQSTMAVRIIVIPSDARAGTASREIQKQHHESMTRVTPGEKTEETKYSRRRLNENITLRPANEPACQNGKNTTRCSKNYAFKINDFKCKRGVTVILFS